MLNAFRKIDPRYLFLCFFLGVFADAFCFGINMKTKTQLLCAILGALGTDIVFNRLRHGKWIFPLSGLVSSCGTFMLISSPYNWPFFLLGFLATYSKHFVTFAGRHVFNPVNFGAAFCLFYLQDFVQSGSSSWSGNFFMLPYLVLFGTLLVMKANSLIICLSYLAAFALVHFLYLAPHLPVNIASFSSPPFMLFIFFMISDPKTTPRQLLPQIAFGASIAVVEGYFKISRILNGGIWALLIVSLVYLFLIPLIKQTLTQVRGKAVA